ncbi:hypothetical protein [Mesorhizobium sp. M0227]|uniref:hypothetical protein n=1 Tax=unclassified Mesorhizobium TaxID=325217 RepID=UPI003337D0C9
MLLSANNAISTAVLAGRGVNAEVFGVVDLSTKTEAKIGPITLGMAIQLVANASVLGYDVRGAMIFYGEPGTPSLGQESANACGAQFGGALCDRNPTIFRITHLEGEHSPSG